MRFSPRFFTRIRATTTRGQAPLSPAFCMRSVPLFLTRNDNGRRAPNYSYLLGNMCAGALSNLYYPQANRGPNLVFTNAAIGLAGRISGNILREFSKRLTTNVPGDGRQ